MKNNQQKISVIITTYNRATLLEEAIKSVLMQTYDNVEIIVIDDCSSDNTKEIVEKFKSDKIIYYKNEKNKGCGINRKEGLAKYATGEYIIFLDDDDKFIDEKYFEKDGKRYHHILNPETGYPAETELKSVTIIADSGLVADGLSTACFVLGREKSQALLEEYNAEAIFVDKDNNVYITDGIFGDCTLLNDAYTVKEYE